MEQNKVTDNIDRYIPREISWVDFNARVLDEAIHNPAVPHLEQLKFLAIVASNFDEFFMVRVAALKDQIASGVKNTCPSGMPPGEQLNIVLEKVRSLMDQQYDHFLNTLIPVLREEKIVLLSQEELNEEQQEFTKELFDNSIFPVLAPLQYNGSENQPLIANLGINIAFLVTREKDDINQELVIVQIPKGLDRIIWIPGQTGESSYMLVEDIIRMNAPMLFPGYRICDSICFRVTRDADMAVDEQRDEDFVEAMSEVLLQRIAGEPIRLEMEVGSEALKLRISELLGLGDDAIFLFNGPLNLKDFMTLSFVKSFNHLQYERWDSWNPLQEEDDIWELLKQKDLLLHHPYDSFQPVIRLLQEAAVDPDVLSIRMTLYRTSGDSPVVKALSRAALNGKQVIVLVELKARFDEQNNIEWARELEKAGVIVIYGVARLKVHSKAMLIVRREAEGVKRYIHLGTGNYNEKTAKLYTDLSLLSSKDELSYETALYFNSITGYSSIPTLRELVMAPVSLKDKFITMIAREAERSSKENPGLILAKMNSLADPDVIEALYAASQKFVIIKLNIRGICMLRAGVPQLSENITVCSIIDRYLEHSRIFYFKNGGREELYCSSADWMPRNLEKRIELMFPILDQSLKKRIRKILQVFFDDNVNNHCMQKDGSYKRLNPGRKKRVRAQEYFHKKTIERMQALEKSTNRELTVRRKAPKDVK